MIPDGAAPVAALVLTLLLAPLVPGIATRTRALLTGRRGSPVWQLYADLWKLSRRGIVYARVTTMPFRLVPVVAVGGVLAAALLVPLDGRSSVFSFSGDVVAFVYTLALARFVLVLGALDTGSSFEGMGASREVTVAALAELAFLLCFAALSVVTRELSLGGMTGAPLSQRWASAAPALVLVAAGLFILLLAECSRSPVDDPTTHLELTMIHEVMVLDHGGPDLGLIQYGAALKLWLIGALLIGLMPLHGANAWLAIGTALLGMTTLAVAVGMIESAMARYRMVAVPRFIVGATTLSAVAFIVLLA